MTINNDHGTFINLFCDGPETTFDVYAMISRPQLLTMGLIKNVTEDLSIALEKYYTYLKPVEGTHEYVDTRNGCRYSEEEYKSKIKSVLEHLLEQRMLEGEVIFVKH